jgi:hypothetical protein
MHENEIGTVIVDCAVHLHKDLGPGLHETVYEVTLARKLEKRGLSVQRHARCLTVFCGVVLGRNALIGPNWKSILSAFAALSIVTILGVGFFYKPIAETDTISGPLLNPAIGFFVYVALSIALFDWVARQLRNAYQAAFIVATSQFILVNVDFVLRGERGLRTAAASTVLMVATWVSVAYAYSLFSKEGRK